jgi:hypothetical protein
MGKSNDGTIISIISVIVGLIASFAGSYIALMLSSIRREIDSLKAWQQRIEEKFDDIHKQIIDIVKREK